jgi:transposase
MTLDGVRKEKIIKWTGVSSRQLRRLLEYWRDTGIPFKACGKSTGRPLKLAPGEIEVHSACIIQRAFTQHGSVDGK